MSLMITVKSNHPLAVHLDDITGEVHTFPYWSLTACVNQNTTFSGISLKLTIT